jgi:2-polyprenyl-3-methyl-5-hydroxy-6-metoxy-1,4-benzoquinol methylase
MATRTVSAEDLARLKREREEADRRYNEALTAVDLAIQRPGPLPHPPPPRDHRQVTPLNERWAITDSIPPLPGGWRGRVASFMWGLLRPVLERQQAFNSALVDHINRNLPIDAEAVKAIATTIAVLGEQAERLAAFQSRLVVYLQQVTPYVDTKDYEFAGLSRREIEDAKVDAERLDHVAQGLAKGLGAAADQMLRRWESLLARDQRYDARFDELRMAVAAAQQQATALKRAFAEPPVPRVASQEAVAEAEPAPAGGTLAASDTLESWKYVGFEDQFRGQPDDIRQRLEPYAAMFDGAADVLDIGCGRGEFLDLLVARGVTARGIDLNHEMVEVCRSRGLHVDQIDALSYLRQQPDGGLGGLFAAQVVEHLQPDYLLALLDQAQRVLRPGSQVVLETINVASVTAFFESYIRDITHARPLHPATLRYLVVASGFADVSIRYSAPIPPANRLQPAPPLLRRVSGEAHDALTELADAIDGNVERLNRLMFADMDYAVVARRP